MHTFYNRQSDSYLPNYSLVQKLYIYIIYIYIHCEGGPVPARSGSAGPAPSLCCVFPKTWDLMLLA